MVQELRAIINGEYIEIQSELSKVNPDYNSVTDRYNTILEIKRNSTISESIYLDLKQISKYHLLSIDHKNFNYDKLNFDFIKRNLIELHLAEKIDFLEFLNDLLKKSDLKDKFCDFKFDLFKAKVSNYWHKCSFVNIIKIFLLSINYNIYTLLIFLLLFVCSLSVIFLPAPDFSIVLFEIESDTFHQNSFLNNMYNVSLWLSGLNDDLKIKPLNCIGLTILIIIRIIFIGVLIDVIFNELKNKLKL
ncbi:MAG: hypothetical protein V4622_07700 [Bacteroidota bacterium]